MIEKCKLCNQYKELRKSHIFPRAFFRQVKDNGKYIYLDENGLGGIAQKDWWEYLFCGECEQIISGYEATAVPIFKNINEFAETYNCSAIEFSLSKEQNKNFELFKLSILYRLLLVDKEFRNYYFRMILFIDVIKGEKYLYTYKNILEFLRLALLKKELPKKQYWPVKLKKIYDWINGVNISGLIGEPHFNKPYGFGEEKMVFVLNGIIIESNMSLDTFFSQRKEEAKIKVPKTSVFYFKSLPKEIYTELKGYL